jgi:hypothetical protein
MTPPIGCVTQASQPVKPAERARLDDARCHLRRADHHAGDDRLRWRCAESFHDARQMRGHRRRHRPGRGKSERQQHHRSVDLDVRLDDWSGCVLRWRRLRKKEYAERKSDQDVRGNPGVACAPPYDSIQAKRTERPADGTGKGRDQGDSGDRLAGVVAVDSAERAERGVAEAESHPDTEEEPGGRHSSGEADAVSSIGINDLRSTTASPNCSKRARPSHRQQEFQATGARAASNDTVISRISRRPAPCALRRSRSELTHEREAGLAYGSVAKPRSAGFAPLQTALELEYTVKNVGRSWASV